MLRVGRVSGREPRVGDSLSIAVRKLEVGGGHGRRLTASSSLLLLASLLSHGSPTQCGSAEREAHAGRSTVALPSRAGTMEKEGELAPCVNQYNYVYPHHHGICPVCGQTRLQARMNLAVEYRDPPTTRTRSLPADVTADTSQDAEEPVHSRTRTA